jgi:hypothetical protein
MSYTLPNTPDNVAFAATVSRRIKAAGSRTAAIAAMYRWFGRGLFVIALGAGAGAAAYGVSYITDDKTSMAKLSDALATALSQITLKVDEVKGTVTVDPGDAKLPLNTTGATVRLDANGATVRLDTSGARLDASNFPRPTPQQLQLPTPSPDRKPADPKVVATDYTVFKHVRLGEGEIVTGWKFHSSEDERPFGEYCYYMAKADADTSAIFNVGRDGKASGKAPAGLPVKFQDAVANCQWFAAGAATAPTPTPNPTPRGSTEQFVPPR